MLRLTRATLAVLVMSVLLAGSLQARDRQPPDAFDLAKLSFPAVVRPDVPAVVRVALRSDETLQISVELYSLSRGLELTKTLHRKRRIGAAAFDDLLLDVKVLSNAEVQMARESPLCRRLRTPFSMTRELEVLRGYDLITDTFLGEMERILQVWCEFPVKIRPVGPDEAERAARFQAKVGILATQMLKALLVEAHI